MKYTNETIPSKFYLSHHFPPNILYVSSNTSLNGNVKDVNVDSDSLFYSLEKEPKKGSVFVNYVSGGFTYTPHANYVGSDEFTIEMKHANELFCKKSYTIHITAQAPISLETQELWIAKNTQLTGNFNAIDPQKSKLIYEIESQASHGSLHLHSTDGSFIYQPFAQYHGKDYFRVRITNAHGLFCLCEVFIQILNPKIDFTKHTETYNIAVGENYSYQLNIQNTGNVKIENAIICDTLPEGMKVLQLLIDGSSVNQELTQGICMGSLEPGEKKSLLIIVDVYEISHSTQLLQNKAMGYFDVLIHPNLPPMTFQYLAKDESKVSICLPVLTLKKSSNFRYSAVGENILYKITATNEGNVDLNNVLISDGLSPHLEYVPNSLFVNGKKIDQQQLACGVSVGNLTIGQTSTISFLSKIVEQGSGLLENQAEAFYHFFAKADKEVHSGFSKSNIVKIKVIHPSLQLVQEADKNRAALGDIITYKAVLSNEGNSDVINIIYKDKLPEELQLVSGSFHVDDKKIRNVNLQNGVNIGDLKQGDRITIFYKVKIIKMNNQGKIFNHAYANYGYILVENNTIRRKETNHVSFETVLKISTFKQLTIEKMLCLPDGKENIKQINDITGEIEIDYSYFVDTATGESLEGQSMTGQKLITHGVLTLYMDYTADNYQQKVHSCTFKIPFSSFIVIPTDAVCCMKSKVEAQVEYVYFKQKNKRYLLAISSIMMIAYVQ